MFAFLGIVFTVTLLVLSMMLLVNIGSNDDTSSVCNNTSTCFLIKIVIGLLLIGMAVCWLKSCS